MTASSCDFNRSMQHLISDDREEDVEDRWQSLRILHSNYPRTEDKLHVGGVNSSDPFILSALVDAC